ncbi:tetratricopeptide repeat protein [Calditrichota bacterium LG25]
MKKLISILLLMFIIVACHPTYIDIYADIKVGRYNDALNEIERLAKLGKNIDKDWYLLSLKGVALYHLNKMEMAINSLEKAMSIKNNKDVTKLLLKYYEEYADYLNAKGKCEKAIEYYKKYIKLSKEFIKVKDVQIFQDN